MYDEDMDVLERIRDFSAKKRRSFNNVINSKNLSTEELDELFLD